MTEERIRMIENELLAPGRPADEDVVCNTCRFAEGILGPKGDIWPRPTNSDCAKYPMYTHPPKPRDIIWRKAACPLYEKGAPEYIYFKFDDKRGLIPNNPEPAVA
jgi:hypothetical protein